MLHRLERRVVGVVAFALLAAMAVVPSAMAWADDSPGTAHAVDHHRSPHSHDQLRDDCCDLCLTSCIACVGLVGNTTTLQGRLTPWIAPAIIGRAARTSADPLPHRLPFPLGPPLLRA
jgi:hypothetical protein